MADEDVLLRFSISGITVPGNGLKSGFPYTFPHSDQHGRSGRLCLLLLKFRVRPSFAGDNMSRRAASFKDGCQISAILRKKVVSPFAKTGLRKSGKNYCFLGFYRMQELFDKPVFSK